MHPAAGVAGYIDGRMMIFNVSALFRHYYDSYLTTLNSSRDNKIKVHIEI